MAIDYYSRLKFTTPHSTYKISVVLGPTHSTFTTLRGLEIGFVVTRDAILPRGIYEVRRRLAREMKQARAARFAGIGTRTPWWEPRKTYLEHGGY